VRESYDTRRDGVSEREKALVTRRPEFAGILGRDEEKIFRDFYGIDSRSMRTFREGYGGSYTKIHEDDPNDIPNRRRREARKKERKAKGG
jgi:hypothetical protein